MLNLQSVNLNLANNKLAHHTSDYVSGQLILRRGQPFQVTLKLSRTMKPADNITFKAEIGKSPSVENKTKATFSLSTTPTPGGSWTAVPDVTNSRTVTVTITSPVTAIIGSYRLTVNFFSGGFTSHVLGDFILLFNPWVYDDVVYLTEESEREEYVLSDSTIFYYGNEDYIGEDGWNLGQFEEGILPICLLILEKQTSADLSQLFDPKQVSRVCSAMINNNDDKGVVWGNWSGNYADGVSPTTWTGSVEILKQWATQGPVRYGQCWVFAGVLCTVMRCLGIPTRIVTNFSSAHDTNENLSIDSFYDPEGNSLGGTDSVWNFHVWNEAWFTREDIGSFYNGWQVLDATPQERSEGVYRLGPTSVKAVKEGDIHLNYDCPFVFSEVNADKKSWIYDDEEGSYEIVETNSSSIGKFTSTKAVGSNDRLDITSNYKYKEGTAEEREVYHNALLQLFGRRTIGTDETDTRARSMPARVARVKPVATQKISGKYKELDTPLVGQDINVILVISNPTSAAENMLINFNANTTGYTRQLMRNILNDSKTITVDSKEEKEIPFKIPYSQYKNTLMDDNVIEVTALCKIDGINKLLISKIITLKRPSLSIEVLKEAVLNNPITAEIRFMNPLSESLTDCELRAEGSGLIKQQIKRIISIKPNEEAKVTIEFTPYMKGSKQLQIVVSGHKIVTIKGYKTILVKEP
ncbi:protein-glutamine gamma-glutamyltransferase E-like [Mixophyes fleayi]|uniref:protein-glutamine gamma-glutamyltransferase E-like n=1 Tax=Mixophyes fleayi TaxID=3061075 RepID=UPI003F4DAB5F